MFRRIALISYLILFAAPNLWAQSEQLELREMERKVEAMKEEILKQKLLLRQVEEDVLYGAITKTRANIVFRNEAHEFFQLVECKFFIDNELVKAIAAKDLPKNGALPFSVFDAEIPPGKHELKVVAYYTIKKKMVFSYVEKYQYSVDASRLFEAQQGRTRAVDVTVFDRGPFKTNLENRLAMTLHFTSGT